MNSPNDSPSDKRRFSYSELLRQVQASSRPVSTDLADRNTIGEQERLDREVERQVRTEWIKLRNRWSWKIAIALYVIIVFQIFLVIKVGSGAYHFEHYQWFLNLVLGQSFLDIIGLGTIIVVSLFPKPPQDK